MLYAVSRKTSGELCDLAHPDICRVKALLAVSTCLDLVDCAQVSASYNCSASITIQLADGEGLLSKLQFKTAVRKLHLYQVVDGKHEIQLKQTAGSELQGLKVELTDEKAEVVDENTLKVVLRYDDDKQVSLFRDSQSVLW